MAAPAFSLITFAYGAAGSDVNDDNTGNITVPPGTTFNDPTGGFFTSANCVAYPDIGVAGAGVAGASFSSGITYVSANSVTLSTAASTNVTNKEWAWGNANGGTIGLNGTTTITYTDPNPIQAGDALFIICSPDHTITATISDSQSNTWSHAFASPGSNADYWQQGFYLIANKSASSLTITVTTSATYVGTGIGTDFVYYHWRPPTGYYAIFNGANQSSGTGATPTSGNLTTTIPIAALMSVAVVGSHTTAGTSGWTYVTIETANGAEYNTVSTTGTYAATFTASSGTYLTMIAAFGAVPFFQPPFPSPRTIGAAALAALMAPTQYVAPPAAPTYQPSPVGDAPRSPAWHATGDFVAARWVDPATFRPTPSVPPDTPRSPPGLWGAGGVTMSLPDPGNSQPNPSTAMPDVRANQAFAAGFVASSPIVAAAVASGPFVCIPQICGGPFAPQSVVASMRLDPAGFQPNPSASYPQPWTGGTAPQSVAANAYVNPAVYQPAPTASYPQPWNGGCAPQSVTASEWIKPAIYQPTPGPSFPQPWIPSIAAQSVVTEYVSAPPTVNPTASYPQRSAEQWHGRGDWVTPQWINPATYQPSPVAISPPGAGSAYSLDSLVTPYVATPAAVVPSAPFPQRYVDQWHGAGDFVTPKWIDPSIYRPSPMTASPTGSGSTYSLTGWATPFVAPAAVPSAAFPNGGASSYSNVGWSTPFVGSPPALVPIATFPQRQPEPWHSPVGVVAAQWINPATFQPLPSAAFPQPWRDGLAFQSFVTPFLVISGPAPQPILHARGKTTRNPKPIGVTT